MPDGKKTPDVSGFLLLVVKHVSSAKIPGYIGLYMWNCTMYIIDIWGFCDSPIRSTIKSINQAGFHEMSPEIGFSRLKKHIPLTLQTRGSKNSKLFIILISHPYTTSQNDAWLKCFRVPVAGASGNFCGLFRYTHRIHVWYIYLHLVDFHGKCS